MHDNDVIIAHHAGTYDHIARTFLVNHRVANNHGITDNHGVPDNHRIADNDVSARDIHWFWLRGHYRSGRRRDDDLLEQRLPMAEAFEVQTDQATPLAFEDEELLRVVVAPVVADFVAALVDDTELVAILQHAGIVDLHFNVQVLLRPCLCRCGRSGTGLIEPRYGNMMPGRRICGLCDSHATQHYCYGE